MDDAAEQPNPADAPAPTGTVSPPPAPGSSEAPPPPNVEEDRAEEREVITAPPIVAEGTGVVMEGDYPHNHRLRAEALARDGKEEDPLGWISPELIADAKGRLEAEERAERLSAPPPVHASMKVAELETIAKDEGVDLTGASNNDQRVERIVAARKSRS